MTSECRAKSLFESAMSFSPAARLGEPSPLASRLSVFFLSLRINFWNLWLIENQEQAWLAKDIVGHC